MTRSNPCLRLVAVALVGLALPGCAGGGGNKFALNPWRGSLKEQLSRLEHRNEELQRELADVRDEVKRISNELELAEIRNTDLATRLDKYRSGSSTLSALPEPDTGGSRTTRPAGRIPYSPPFTQIPNRIVVPDPPSGSGVDRFESAQPLLSAPPVEYYDFSDTSSGAGRRSPSSSAVGRSPDGRGPAWAPVGQSSASGRR